MVRPLVPIESVSHVVAAIPIELQSRARENIGSFFVISRDIQQLTTKTNALVKSDRTQQRSSVCAAHLAIDNFMEITPIEPVMVVGWATILSHAAAIM